jgi:DNA-binding transcriptional LysR family regulator
MSRMDEKINLRLLRYFLAVAEELHFGRAAKRLHIAQPPLSQQIKLLEQALGFPLFERTSRRVALTPAGETMVAVARQCFADLKQGVAAARLEARGKRVLRIGYVTTAILTFLPATVRAFRARHPATYLQLCEVSSSLQLHALRAGNLDIAIVTDPVPDPLIRRHILLADPLLLILPSAHRFVRRRTSGKKGRLGKKDLAELAADPFLLFPRAQTPSLWDHIMKACSENGFVPQVHQEAQSWHAIFGMIAAGMGISVAPASAMEHRVPGVAFRRLKAPATNICACVGAEDRRELVQSFIQAARDRIKKGDKQRMPLTDCR